MNNFIYNNVLLSIKNEKIEEPSNQELIDWEITIGAEKKRVLQKICGLNFLDDPQKNLTIIRILCKEYTDYLAKMPEPPSYKSFIPTSISCKRGDGEKCEIIPSHIREEKRYKEPLENILVTPGIYQTTKGEKISLIVRWEKYNLGDDQFDNCPINIKFSSSYDIEIDYKSIFFSQNEWGDLEIEGGGEEEWEELKNVVSGSNLPQKVKESVSEMQWWAS